MTTRIIQTTVEVPGAFRAPLVQLIEVDTPRSIGRIAESWCKRPLIVRDLERSLGRCEQRLIIEAPEASL